MVSKNCKFLCGILLIFSMICSLVAVQPGVSKAAKAKKLILNKSRLTLYVGEKETIKVKKVIPKNAGKSVKYKSSKKSIATVTKKGVVTAISEGTAKITVTAKSNKKVKKAVKVTVRNKDEETNIPDIPVNPQVQSNVPVITDIPVQSSEPIRTEAPVVTDEPVYTENPNKTADPALENDVTQKPTIPTEVPVTEAPVTKPTATPITYPPGYVYKQRSKMVTRWFSPGSVNGHPHDGYKNHDFAIWVVGFYDNDYDSTNDPELNEGIYGPALDDYKGKPLTIKGQFMYEGYDQKTILLQLNYTSPEDHPVVWKWEKGADKQPNNFAAGLKMKGINGSPEAKHGVWYAVNATFTIPNDDGNYDIDVGNQDGIYLYFANRPGGTLAYREDNTFIFRNFEIKGDGGSSGMGSTDTPTPTKRPTPTSTPTPTPFELPNEALKDNADFAIGTVIKHDKIYDKDFTKLVTQQFDVVSFENEMQGYALIDAEASQAAVATEGEGVVKCRFDAADEMVKWAQDNGLKVRGHVLFWELSMPNAFFYKGYRVPAEVATDEEKAAALVDAETLKARMESYANQVISHFEEKFPGEVIAWDVVNEAINADSSAAKDETTKLYLNNDGNFYKILGGEYIKYAFEYAQAAKKAANADINLFYNDFNCFQSPKTDRIVDLIKYLNSDENNKLLDCMGMEGYVLTYWPSASEVKSAMEKFADLGVKVGINELCIRLSQYYNEPQGSPVTDNNIADHAQKYADMFKVYCDFNKAHPDTLTNVSIWGLFDRPDLIAEFDKPESEYNYDYYVYGTHSGLFDENYKAKDAFNRVIEVLKSNRS